jgi:peptide/nickel transport system substrate-binding protein
MRNVVRAIALAAAVLLIVTGCGGPKGKKAEIKNPDTFIYVAYGSVDSLDPAKAYDNCSGGLLQNLYEGLIAYDGPSTTKFIPVLATKVPSVENGGISKDGKTYTFEIRKGVKFHSGNKLTPEVVAYSFKRNLVVDCEGGPIPLIYEPLFGIGTSSTDVKGDGTNQKITLAMLDQAIEVKGNTVVFHLKEPYSPFLSVLANYWGSIIDMEFAKAHGDWDGTEEGIAKANRPEQGKEPLTDIASGTGPYKLVRIDKATEVVFERFEDYWGKKPALAKAIYKNVEEWSTRKLMLQQGDADYVLVDPMYFAEMDKEPGIKRYPEFGKEGTLVELSNRGISFNQKIAATDNPYIYSGKLDGKGVPPDFFADKNVRLAFTYAFDKATYLKDINMGFGIAAETPIPSGLPYFNPDLKPYPYDPAKAAEYFKAAFGGQLWEKGFQLDLTYNAGNDVRAQTMAMLAESLKNINPKFKVQPRAVDWATFVQQQNKKVLPIFYIGWGADFADPHNFIYTYMYSKGGLYANRCSYSNPEADKLIEEGLAASDPAARKAAYYRLQDIWLEDVPGIMLHQPIRQQYFKDWVKGYYFHPMENNPNQFAMYSKGY